MGSLLKVVVMFSAQALIGKPRALAGARTPPTPPLDGTVAAPNYLAAHQPPLTFDFGGRSLVGPCIVREDDRQRRAL